MSLAQSDERTRPRRLRLWPGVVLVTLQWLLWLAVPIVLPEAAMYAVIGGVIGGLAVIVWWAFFSRAHWAERVGVVVVMIAALVATPQILHKSIATGMMGFMFPMYAVPVLSLAFVTWAVATRRLSDGLRRASMVATILLACGGFALLRTHGITGEGDSDFAWRWSESPEERLLAEAGDNSVALPPTPAPSHTLEEPPPERPGDEPAAIEPPPPAAEKRAEWPGFRGPGRDGVVRGVRIATDWSQSPPLELWRRPIGPGWSSFAVSGDLVYTQEQRGDDEVVACYKLTTGEPVWAHRDTARFWESNAGAGPRGTPTLSNGRVYTFGATGILNSLNADDGTLVWSRDVATDSGTKVPEWGFASSPLVAGDVVIVAAAGKLAAYDLASGDPRWFGPDGGWGYSSPQLATINGVEQIVLLNGAGAISVSPAHGELLWKQSWPGDGIVQPALTTDGEVLIGTGSGLGSGSKLGILNVSVTNESSEWTVEERWTSAGLKPYFNDFVVHNGHAFGFDGFILSCISLEDGKRKWKGGRYGHGQLVVLADQDLLLVLSEDGELALVSATPDKFTELARFPAIDGKTWNHPVLVGDTLLVRNGQEMAAFRLSRAGG